MEDVSCILSHWRIISIFIFKKIKINKIKTELRCVAGKTTFGRRLPSSGQVEKFTYMFF
jgi:hypothetical protein